MTITIQPPKPGDLITSNFMKLLIDQLIALDKRIADLEEAVPGADGKLAITQVTPTNVAIGDQLQVFGVNFGIPTDNIVTFDGASSVVPTIGSDRRLFVTVPPINLGNAQSKPVLLGVSNLNGFDSFPITVHQVVPTIPGGTVTVTPGQIPAITPGADWTIPFTIEARTNMNESFDLVPTVPNVPTGQPPWVAKMVADGTPHAAELPKPYRIFIPKPEAGQVSTKLPAFMRVTIPANTPVTNPFVQLDVISIHNPPPNPNPLSGTTGPVTFQFGQQQQPQTVGFTITSLTGITGDKTMVSVPTSSTTPTPPINGVNYLFQGLKAGRYTATLSWSDTTNHNRGWTASFGGAPSQPNWPVTTLSINMTAAGDFGPQKVAIVGVTGATQNTLRITVRADANPTTDFGIHNQGVKPAS